MNGCVIRDAPQKIRNDQHMLKKACEQNPMAIQFVSKLQQDSNFIRSLLFENRKCFEFLQDYQDKKEFVKLACRNDLRNFQFASNNLKNDQAFIKEIFTLDQQIFKYVPEEMKNDLEIGRLGVTYTPELLLNFF